MDQSKAYSQQRGRDVPKKEKYIPKVENADWIKSTLDGGKHPSKCKWFNLSNFANFMLALIVLSSITKNGEIVTNIAPFMSFRFILVIG